MKINEVTTPSEKAIFEAIDATNNSGFLTEDLVGVVAADRTNQWESHDANDYIKNLLEGKMPWAAN
jgi:hypothetical protein